MKEEQVANVEMWETLLRCAFSILFIEKSVRMTTPL